MTQWEYMFPEVHRFDVDTKSDELGALGWELVTAALQGDTWYLAFKRAVELPTDGAGS